MQFTDNVNETYFPELLPEEKNYVEALSHGNFKILLRLIFKYVDIVVVYWPVQTIFSIIILLC